MSSEWSCLYLYKTHFTPKIFIILHNKIVCQENTFTITLQKSFSVNKLILQVNILNLTPPNFCLLHVICELTKMRTCYWQLNKAVY